MSKETSLSLYKRVNSLRAFLELMDEQGRAISHKQAGECVELVNRVFEKLERRSR